MRRYSLNTLKNSFELGSTSNWVLAFEGVGSKSPDVSKLNLINGEYCPVLDVSYDDYNVIIKELSIGPGAVIALPVFLHNAPKSISITFYDDHSDSIRTELNNWVKNKLQIIDGKAPLLSELKDSSLLVKIFKFDKTGTSIGVDSFYLLPSDSFSGMGDQSFSASTSPISFTVIGTQ